MSETNIITVAEAKQALQISETSNTDDQLLASLVGSISSRLDQACGPVVQRTITGELHDGGRTTIWLHHYPVISVTQCREYSGTTYDTLTEHSNGVEGTNEFLLDRDSGKLTSYSNGLESYFTYGKKNITVTYEAGRYTDTASVDPLFKDAAKIFLSHVYRMGYGLGTDTYGAYDAGQAPVSYALPNRVKDLLGDEIRDFELG